MGEQKRKRNISVGLLAHVDAGKTTLSEAMMYLTGSIRKLGRVDHKDTFLDTFALERARGITIFSKQARFMRGNVDITLLDTPGHVDFSAEMERTLQVLDYAILVVSGGDGVQGHTYTLWKLLERYHIPVMVFVNKMDQEGTDRQTLLAELKNKLSGNCVEFDETGDREAFEDELAMCDEALMEEFLDSGCIEQTSIAEAIAGRAVFPCYFGSALKLEGVDELLDGLCRYAKSIAYGTEFRARVYRIARDDQGNRLTYLKLTGGSLKVKMPIQGLMKGGAGDSVWEEKISQIRLYSGEKFEAVSEVSAGIVCAVSGLNYTYPGQGLGIEEGEQQPILEPVLTYRIQLPAGTDARSALVRLRQLEEEEPELHIVWNERLGEIHAQLMGEVQIEVLKSLIAGRFGLEVSFDEGSIVYKETIAEAVEGVGHYEPLRHYAEVHLLLTPGEPGSGMQFEASCSEDILDRNWQRLILAHLEEKEHLGVLTGSPITDMRISLLTGRAHLKHTEGGDFRQATYRAVRQGLMMARSVLLEPWYQYRLEVPQGQVGRAMNDIQAMFGEFSAPETSGEMAVLTGKAPVSEMRNYQAKVAAYTSGRGKLSCVLAGYEPCHNADEVIESIGYDSEADMDNPTGSVFCAHGAGFRVGWDEVRDYMHLDSGWISEQERQDRLARIAETEQKESALAGKQAGTSEETTMKLRTKAVDERESTDGSTGGSETGYRGIGFGDLSQAGKQVSGTVDIHKASSAREDSSRIYRGTSWGSSEEEKKLEAIFSRTYGAIKQERSVSQGAVVREYSVPEKYKTSKKELQTEYLVVDGYNVIFAWDELRELAEDNIDGARTKLMDILSNYQGIRRCVLILVFDAYKVKGGTEKVRTYHNIHVVYTREAETADQYIEKATHRIAKNHQVTVATSDGVEQVIILGQGAARMSSRELKEEVERTSAELRRDFLEKPPTGKNLLIHHVDDEMREMIEDVRLGRKVLDENKKNSDMP